MIKINLLKPERKGRAVDFAALKEIKLQEVLKAGPEYYLGFILWLFLLLLIAYNYKLNQDRVSLRKELERLNVEKAQLQARAARFIEERKEIEKRIAGVRKDIESLDKNKDVILGLKSYYEPFNSSFLTYTARIPKISWIGKYGQSLDMEKQRLSVNFEFHSPDYRGITAYSESVGGLSKEAGSLSLERRLNHHGVWYYTAKLSVEKPLSRGRVE